MAARAQQRCCVCAATAPKYRCPGCRLRYCSVPCCKKHKEECVPKSEPRAEAALPEISPAFRGSASPGKAENGWSVEDIIGEDGESDEVPLQKLKLLEESKELKELLLNPHLGQLLVTIDQAEEKEAAMKKYMQEPLFTEFADCCLRIIEPPQNISSFTIEAAEHQAIQDLILQ